MLKKQESIPMHAKKALQWKGTGIPCLATKTCIRAPNVSFSNSWLGFFSWLIGFSWEKTSFLSQIVALLFHLMDYCWGRGNFKWHIRCMVGQSGQYAWFRAIAYMECATVQGIPMPCHINDCIKGYGMGWHITCTILKKWIQLLKSKRALNFVLVYMNYEIQYRVGPKLPSITLRR
jgi:hypothetical protein